MPNICSPAHTELPFVPPARGTVRACPAGPVLAVPPGRPRRGPWWLRQSLGHSHAGRGQRKSPSTPTFGFWAVAPASPPYPLAPTAAGAPFRTHHPSHAVEGWHGEGTHPGHASTPHQHTAGPGSSLLVPQPQGPILPPWPELQLLLHSQLSPSGCFCLLLPQAPEPFPHPAPSFSLCPRSTLAVLPYGQSIFPGLSSMLSKRNQIISQAFRLCVQGSWPQA